MTEAEIEKKKNTIIAALIQVDQHLARVKENFHITRKREAIHIIGLDPVIEKKNIQDIVSFHPQEIDRENNTDHPEEPIQTDAAVVPQTGILIEKTTAAVVAMKENTMTINVMSAGQTISMPKIIEGEIFLVGSVIKAMKETVDTVTEWSMSLINDMALVMINKRSDSLNRI